MAFSDIINRELLSAALGQFKTKLATVFAPLSNPALTGTPTAPTAEAGTDSTQIATTAFVTEAVGTEAARSNAVVVTVTGLAALPATVTDPRITADMVVVRSVLSNPVAQLCDWTVTPADGSLTIAKAGEKTGIGYGGTNLTLYLQHTGSETAQVSTIKQEFALPTAGLFYSRTFEAGDDESIFNSDYVSAGRILAYRSGGNITIRLQNITTAVQLPAGSSYPIATLPENARIMLMQQGYFMSGSYHGAISITAATGAISLNVWDTTIPAGTFLTLYMPVFNVARDHNDQDMTGYTLTAPNA